MKTFEVLPSIAPPEWRRFLVAFGFLPFFFPFLPLITWASHVSKWIEYPIFFLAAVVCFFGMKLVMALSGRQFMPAQAAKYRKEFPPDVDERFVGIAYCDHIWAFRGETCWDLGYVSIRDGALHYRGRGPSFNLPLESITRVWIMVQRGTASSLPRVNVEWEHPASGLNVLSLEYREGRNKRDDWKAAQEFVRWIERARLDSSSSTDIIWPFESRSLDFAKDPSKQSVQLVDITLGILAGVVIFSVGLALDMWVRHRSEPFASGVSGAVGYLSFQVYRAVLTSRIIARGKASLG